MIFVKKLNSKNPYATQILVKLEGELERKFGDFAVVSYSIFSDETCVFPCDQNGDNMDTSVVIDESGESLEDYCERMNIDFE